MAPSPDSVVTIQQLHSQGKRVIVINDFPDLPSNASLRTTVELADHSIFISMVGTDLYRQAIGSLGGPIPYTTVVAAEVGACRTIQDLERGVHCIDADVMIAPLIQDIPEVSQHDVAIFNDLLKRAGWRPGMQTVFWVHAGFPEEMAGLARYLRTDPGLERKIVITSSQVEDAIRQSPIDTAPAIGGVVRYARIADKVIASPGYSTFWELYSLGIGSDQMYAWLTLNREVEGIAARLRLLSKPHILDSSTAHVARRYPRAGVQALAKIVGTAADLIRKE